MRKDSVRSLTLGALIAAILGVMLAISNFAPTAYDSMMFYLIPIPIALYVYMKDYKWGFMVLLTSLIVGFLIQTNPLNVVIVTLPNLLLGLVFGILKKKTNNLMLILITFFLSIATTILSVVSLEVISHISLFDYFLADFNFFNSIFGINENIFGLIIKIIIPSMIVIDALLKTMFIYIVFIVIAKSLRLDVNYSLHLAITPNRLIGLLTVVLYILNGLIIFNFINKSTTFMQICAQIVVLLTVLMSLYVIFMFIFYLERMCLFTNHKNLIVLVLALSILLFPLTLLAGIFYNLFYNLFQVY